MFGNAQSVPTFGMKNVPADQTVTSIMSTYDYDKFKIMADNRNVNLLHVKRLIESFNDQHLVCPIVVNERFEVIDGQHRLHASIESNKPVYYFIVRGYGIKEVQRLNTNQKNWTKMDYLQTYCAEGLKNYLLFDQFMKDFPDFGFQSCERMLTMLTNGAKQVQFGDKRAVLNDFQEGKLIIPDIKKSYQIAKKVMEFKPYYKNFGRGTFVSAIVPLFDSPEIYNHKEMIGKLKNCPLKITDCDKVETYRLLLEKIYNYKRLNGNKVSFRYL